MILFCRDTILRKRERKKIKLFIKQLDKHFIKSSATTAGFLIFKPYNENNLKIIRLSSHPSYTKPCHLI